MPRHVIAQTTVQNTRSRPIRAVLLVEAPAAAVLAALLNQHYDDAAKVTQLIDGGTIQALGPELGQKHPFDLWVEARQRGWTTFYGRDRDAMGCGPMNFGSTATFARWCEEQSVAQYFIHTPDGWRFADPYSRVEGPLSRLIDALPASVRNNVNRQPIPATFRAGSNVLEEYLPNS